MFLQIYLEIEYTLIGVIYIVNYYDIFIIKFYYTLQVLTRKIYNYVVFVYNVH